MTIISPIDRMNSETRVNYGPVPHQLFNRPLDEMQWQILGDEFLLRGCASHYFYYRKGQGVTIERGPGADVSEESLWLNGSVYAGVASLNGLMPIHASAVESGGHVFAFTGPGGAGKSTLVAALGDLGLPMFCDDTLILDLSDPDRVMCLPGHKRLKLTPEALALTGADRQEKVSATVGKYYSLAASGVVGDTLPLGELIFLEEGEGSIIEPVSGSQRFARLQDDHHTAHLFAWARRFERADQFAHSLRLAQQISMARFVRPHDPDRFHAGVAIVKQYLEGRSNGPA